MKKINTIVDDLLNKHPGGDLFFDKFDSVIRLPRNLDVVQELFKQIYKENGNKFNVVVSGKFGDWIKFLVDKGVLNIQGNLLFVSGSLRGKGTYQHKQKLAKKDVEVLSFKTDFHDQDFIFLDDSYYSGSTKKAIEEFLKRYNSRILRTYVIYDGKEEMEPDRKSLYRYYDHKKAKIIPVQKLYDVVDKLKEEIPFDKSHIYNRISTGEIRTTHDLFKLIKNISNKLGTEINTDKLYDLTYRTRYEKKHFIISFKDYIKS